MSRRGLGRGYSPMGAAARREWHGRGVRPCADGDEWAAVRLRGTRLLGDAGIESRRAPVLRGAERDSAAPNFAALVKMAQADDMHAIKALEKMATFSGAWATDDCVCAGAERDCDCR